MTQGSGSAFETISMGQIRLLVGELAGRPGSVRRPVAFFVIICAAAGLLSPSFLTVNNLVALLTSSSFLVVVAVGEAIVVLVGMIDLGVESVVAASGMLIARLTVFEGVPAGPAVVLTLAAGALVGVVAGLLVARGGIPSFITRSPPIGASAASRFCSTAAITSAPTR